MLGYVLLGLCLLAAAIVVLFSLSPAGISRIGEILRYGAAGLAALFGLLGLLTGRLIWAVIGFGAAGLIYHLGRPAVSGGSGEGPGSHVETRFLRMHLDHDSGTIEGEVLDGRFRGRRVEELTAAEVVDLMSECMAHDPQGARLLEAYLDRVAPDWRDRGAEEAAPDTGRSRMGIEEARQVLGVGPDAGADEIRAAHRRLMRQYHPDRGGSTYLAAKINEAKEILLGDR